jgi:hypothetical protein
MSWSGIDSRVLRRWSTDDPSCILDAERLRLADGSVTTAISIHDAVSIGRTIEFRTLGLDGRPCANPVMGSVRTFAEAVRITFVDGRSVALTSAHRLPAEAPVVRGSDTEQCTITAGQVRPGHALLDGVVRSVEQLGPQRAVRLWTAHPAWIQTAQGLSIGTRWHEILHGWAVTSGEHEETVPVSIHGFPWTDGERSGDLSRPSLDLSKIEWYYNADPGSAAWKSKVARGDLVGQTWTNPAIYGTIGWILDSIGDRPFYEVSDVAAWADHDCPGAWQERARCVARPLQRYATSLRLGAAVALAA